MRAPKEFVGRWRITETEVWARDALDMMVPAHITIDPNGHGRFEMIAVVGEIDAQFERDRVDFTWVGNDEMDPASGRGWAVLPKEGELRGCIYFHHGDDSAFVARRAAPRAVVAKRSARKRTRAR
jgi:hypothetical protein